VWRIGGRSGRRRGRRSRTRMAWAGLRDGGGWRGSWLMMCFLEPEIEGEMPR
jgi:hypothetical protein